jgi:AbrB family looped-hinge helix DNA binding protein
MGLTMEIHVGKKRTIVIPKAIAEALNIDEGSRILLELKNEYVIIKPLPDAITLSLKGEKIARITLEELEVVSVEEQKKHIGKN